VEEPDDESLTLRVGAGDRDAFRELMDRHLGRIVAFAGRTLHDRAAAEDVAQETFLRLWTHASRWRPTARLTAWLHRVAMNLCLDRLARARDAALDDVAEPRDPGPPVMAQLHAQEVGRKVNAALAGLPAQQRIAITLCHYQGLSNAEAADVLGVSIEALESLLARGRRTLRTRLGGMLPDLLGDA
jgi:RNA polymerase sigma-70 factor (ECF subfamily)